MSFINHKKAQGAIEFLILTGVIIFFFTLFFISVNESIGDKVKEKRNMKIIEVAESVQDEINLASRSSDGYFRVFKVPDDIEGVDYNINITEGMVYVKSSDDKQAVALPIHTLTGQVVKGDNIIKKEDGKIYLNP